ncbi:MAG: protein kinase [Anaerolineaceae bacterium]
MPPGRGAIAPIGRRYGSDVHRQMEKAVESVKDSLYVRKKFFHKTSKEVVGVPQFCNQCGKKNNDKAKFCSGCGEKLDSSGTTIISTPQILDDRYEIITTVKSGGMGCIFKAKDTRLDNIVAVKQMLSSFTNPQDAQYAETRFKEEAKMLSALHHNGLPKVIDYFTVKEPSTGKKLHYLVMTFIEGKDLETIIYERGQNPFPVDEVLDYFKQILDILEYLHTQSPPIVYRDLNPRNIMVQKEKLFLVDFGIARIFTPQQKCTAIGTPGYAAFEQCQGNAEPRSDFYSLGVVMHYLLTGKNPENSTNLFTFEQARKLNPSVPEYLDTLIMSMVDIVIDKRPRNIEAVKKALNKKHAATNQGSKKSKTATQTTQTPPKIIESNEDKKYSDIFEAIIRGNIHCSHDGNLQAVKAFVRKNPSLVNAKDNINGRTPLHLTNNSLVAEFLISNGADVNAKDYQGRTPLYWASNGKIAALLRDYGARE